MLAKINKLSLLVLLSIVFVGFPNFVSSDSLARSGTIEIPEEGIELDFTI